MINVTQFNVMYRQPRKVVSSCDNAKLGIGVNELSVEPGETGYMKKRTCTVIYMSCFRSCTALAMRRR